MFIPLKMVLIGIDPYPIHWTNEYSAKRHHPWAAHSETIAPAIRRRLQRDKSTPGTVRTSSPIFPQRAIFWRTSSGDKSMQIWKDMVRERRKQLSCNLYMSSLISLFLSWKPHRPELQLSQDSKRLFLPASQVLLIKCIQWLKGTANPCPDATSKRLSNSDCCWFNAKTSSCRARSNTQCSSKNPLFLLKYFWLLGQRWSISVKISTWTTQLQRKGPILQAVDASPIPAGCPETWSLLSRPVHGVRCDPSSRTPAPRLWTGAWNCLEWTLNAYVNHAHRWEF